MSYKLLIFPTPLDAHCTLTLDDSGEVLAGQSDTHPQGRPGQSFTIPTATANGHGAYLDVSAPKKIPLKQRGILFLKDGTLEYPWWTGQTAAFAADDFMLVNEPTPPPNPTPIPPNSTPIQIIQAVYAVGSFDLSTKEGCGLFTEACCTVLHTQHSAKWGHIKKSGAQNQFNGHAVDAVMLLVRTPDTIAGIYDIITDSESTHAKPAFNFAGEPVDSLWFYPAKAR